MTTGLLPTVYNKNPTKRLKLFWKNRRTSLIPTNLTSVSWSQAVFFVIINLKPRRFNKYRLCISDGFINTNLSFYYTVYLLSYGSKQASHNAFTFCLENVSYQSLFTQISKINTFSGESLKIYGKLMTLYNV